MGTAKDSVPNSPNEYMSHPSLMLRPLGDCVTDVHWQDGGMLLRGDECRADPPEGSFYSIAPGLPQTHLTSDVDWKEDPGQHQHEK